MRRSDDSGVVDDAAPEAPSPSSTISSSSSSSCNLSAGLTANPAKPTTAIDNKPEKPSGDRTTRSEDDRKSGDVSGSANPELKSSLISTAFNVDESGCAARPMSLAVTSGSRSQLTRNIVVIVKSTSMAVTEDGAETVQNAVPGSGQVEEPKKTVLIPALTSIGGSPVIHVSSAASSGSTSPCKSVAASNSNRRQQPVDPERRVTQNGGLHRRGSSPSNLSAAEPATTVPTAEESVPRGSGSNDGGITNVVPTPGLSVVKLASLPSTPVNSTSHHVPLVTSKARLAGPVSRLIVHTPERNDRVPSSRVSDKAAAAARQRHRSTPLDASSVKNAAGQPGTSGDSACRKQAAVSSDSDKPNDETPKPKTDLTECVPEISPAMQCQLLPNASPSVRRIRPSTTNTDASVNNVVIGRLKRISPRDDHATPASSSCLVSEKPISRRPTQLGTASRVHPPSDEHTGPVISDPFESLRRRQAQQAASAAALSQVAKIPVRGLSKTRQRPTRSARPKTGRSSVVSVTARTRQASSRQPSAASVRQRRLKTPMSAASSVVGMSSKTPRSVRDRRDRVTRVRRRRSKSNSRKEELEAVADASDVTSTGWRIGTKRVDSVGVSAATRRRSETSRIDRSGEEPKISERSQSTRRSRLTQARTRSFEISERVYGGAPGSRKNDAFSRDAGAAEACKLSAAVAKYKRSTSSSDAAHLDSALVDEVPKDQQGQCKCRVPGASNRLSRGDGKPGCRLCSRRQSQSASPICLGKVTVSPGVDVMGFQPSAAAADEPQRDYSCSRQAGALPTCSSELGRNHNAEPTSAINEMSCRPSRRSSRRSRPADRGGADAAVERGDGNEEDRDRVSKIIDAPSDISPPRANQETTQVASTATDVGGEVVQDADVDLSPRFIRKHDSLVALSSTGASNVNSRRTSVEKAQVGLGTLDDDATLSWHNGFFELTGTANDTVREIGSSNLSTSVYYIRQVNAINTGAYNVLLVCVCVCLSVCLLLSICSHEFWGWISRKRLERHAGF